MADDDAVVVNAHFTERVIGFKFGLFQVFGLECVGIDDDGGIGFCLFVLCLEGCGIHGHEHVTLVAGRVALVGAYVYLEARHTGQ